MLEFQQYQYAFTAHIRDPKKNPKPDNVDEERMSVYRDGVYNNVFESSSVCFPVCQKILGKAAWDSIMRRFFATHHASSPIFREIPQELLAFLQTDEEVPDY
ncbi:MAG TPA: DNA-binding domain-containing protein, partial [Methylophilaceae bacterium]|nr:DNA-binding domain-containing protein [Methylophilaceae bacterium]